MSITENKQEYNKNLSTNLRIKPELKNFLLLEAEEKDTSMSEIVNAMLSKRYNKKIDS